MSSLSETSRWRLWSESSASSKMSLSQPLSAITHSLVEEVNKDRALDLAYEDLIKTICSLSLEKVRNALASQNNLNLLKTQEICAKVCAEKLREYPSFFEFNSNDFSLFLIARVKYELLNIRDRKLNVCQTYLNALIQIKDWLLKDKENNFPLEAYEICISSCQKLRDTREKPHSRYLNFNASLYATLSNLGCSLGQKNVFKQSKLEPALYEEIQAISLYIKQLDCLFGVDFSTKSSNDFKQACLLASNHYYESICHQPVFPTPTAKL